MAGQPYDWEATVLARIRNSGLLARAYGERVTKILASRNDGTECFQVVVLPTRHGEVAAILRPGDHVFTGLPHAPGDGGIPEPVDDRIVYLDRDHPDGVRKLVGMLSREIERYVPAGHGVVPGDHDASGRTARRLVDLATGDPDTARAAIAEALTEVLSAETIESLLESVERHLETAAAPGMN